MEWIRWSDDELYVLLQLIKENIVEYLYGTESLFMSTLHQHFATKTLDEICALVRDLMLRFSVAHATNQLFRSSNIQTLKSIYIPGLDSKSPLPTKTCMLRFLYEIMTHLPENQSQIWLLDELRRFIYKLRQYRHLLSKLQSQDLFFSRVQIWNKSVTETREKFLALYQIHLKHQCGSMRQSEANKTGQSLRLEVLNEIFLDYHAKQLNLIDITNMCTSGWSSVQVQHLLSFLVQGFRLHNKCGMPELLVRLCEFLSTFHHSLMHSENNHLAVEQTGPSIWKKLQSVQKDFQDQLTKTTSLRTSEISIYFEDPMAQVRQILVADWNNAKDVHMIGIRCIRRLCLEYSTSRRKRAGKKMDTLESITQTWSLMNTIEAKNSSLSPIDLNWLTAPQPEQDYSVFIDTISQEAAWESHLTYRVCKAMSQHINLFQSHRYTAFYNEVTKAIPDVEKFDLILNGNIILRKIMTQYIDSDESDISTPSNPQVVLREIAESFVDLNQGDTIGTIASKQGSQADQNGQCDTDGPSANQCDTYLSGNQLRKIEKRKRLGRLCQSHQTSTIGPLRRQRKRKLSRSLKGCGPICPNDLPGDIFDGLPCVQKSMTAENKFPVRSRNQRKHDVCHEQQWMELVEPMEADVIFFGTINATH